MRINVIGTSGSGKSSFSKRLAEKLDVPYIELDALHWKPNWTESTDEELITSPSLTRHKYHTMVTCSGNSAGNSMEIPRQYDGNITGILRINNHRTKIALPKDTRQK